MTRALLQQALGALTWNMDYLTSAGHGTTLAKSAIEALQAALAQPEPDPAAWIVETESSMQGHYCDLELFTDEDELREYCLPYIKPKSIKPLTAIPVGGRCRKIPFDGPPGEWTCTSLSYALERMSVSESRVNSPRRIKGYEVEFLYLAAAAGAAPVKEGWQLVPMEPTDELIEILYGPYLTFAAHESRKKSYKEMLAAAPKEPS